MAGQPVKNGKKTSGKPKSKLVNRSAPVKKERIEGKGIKPERKKRVWQQKPDKKHPEYGTSKLEERFAKDFLDKLKVKYIYQYKAESIGRYFDYYLPDHNIILEIDGNYYHGIGLMYEEMSPMQKKNHRVDKEKDHWCLINSIVLIRITEEEINKHPESVMRMLKERLYYEKGKEDKKKEKNSRH